MTHMDGAAVEPGDPEGVDDGPGRDAEDDWNEDDEDLQIEITRSFYFDRELEEENLTDGMAHWSARLTLGDTVIGRARIFVFDNARYRDIWYPCDAQDEDLARLASAITDKRGRPLRRLFTDPLDDARTVAFVDRLVIEPEHRGRGLGKEFLALSLDAILGPRAAVIAAYPFPLENRKSLAQEHWDRVRSFWTGAGYVHFADGVYVAPHSEEWRPTVLNEWRGRVRRPEVRHPRPGTEAA